MREVGFLVEIFRNFDGKKNILILSMLEWLLRISDFKDSNLYFHAISDFILKKL